MSTLIIVESPAKAKKIGQLLGKDFIVRASMGHINELAKENMGIDIQNNFEQEQNDFLPWVEKYRPKTIDEIISHAQNIETIKKLLIGGSLPHLLFHGSLRDELQYAKLIRPNNNEESLKKYSKSLLRMYIKNQLIYSPYSYEVTKIDNLCWRVV